MSRRKCIFKDNLKKNYRFLEFTYDDSNVRCDKCNATFSVAAGGGNDIENHLKTKKHKVAASFQISIISEFFIGEKLDLNLLTIEGVWAYGQIDDNPGFRFAIQKIISKSNYRLILIFSNQNISNLFPNEKSQEQKVKR